MTASYDPVVWTTEWIAHSRAYHIIEINMKNLQETSI